MQVLVHSGYPIPWKLVIFMLAGSGQWKPVEPCQTFSDFPEISIYLNETRIKHIPHLYQCVKAEISSKIHVAKKNIPNHKPSQQP